MYRLTDCMALLSQMEPLSFSDNGRRNLEAETRELHNEHRISRAEEWYCPVHTTNTKTRTMKPQSYVLNRSMRDLPVCISRRDLRQENILRILEIAAANNCTSKDDLL
jgi:hypothetical protein